MPVVVRDRAALLTILLWTAVNAVACGSEASRPPADLGGDVLAEALDGQDREARELREVEAALRARLATHSDDDPERYDTLIDHALVLTRLVELDESAAAAGTATAPDCGPAARAFGGAAQCAEGDFDLDDARAELLEAIEGWPDGERGDEALLHLGSLEWLGRQYETAAVYFQRLVNVYPESPLLQEACVNLGDIYYEERSFVTAAEAYDCAIGGGEPDLSAYAFYKLAWIDVNLAEYESALANLWQVADLAESSSEVSPELGATAIRDTMLVYVQLERGWERAAADLATVLSAEQLSAYMERLAELYTQLGLTDEAEAVRSGL